MSRKNKVTINKLPTGVPGLDEIMGGGLPEYSFNIIAGSRLGSSIAKGRRSLISAPHGNARQQVCQD
jgi:hypothetical protein